MHSAVNTSSVTCIEYVLHFLIGDHPALCVEARQSVGSNWPCNGCIVAALGFFDLEKCFRSFYLTLDQRRILLRIFHVENNSCYIV